MPYKGTCKVCDSNRKPEIDKLLLAGEKISRIAKMYGLSRPTLMKHQKSHLTNKIVVDAITSLGTEEDLKRRESTLKHISEVVNVVKANAPNTFNNGTSINDIGTQVLKENSPFTKIEWHVEYLYGKVLDTLGAAEVLLDHELVLKSVREGRGILEMIIKASELLMVREQTTSVEKSIGKILEAVKEFPEARKKISEVLYYGKE